MYVRITEIVNNTVNDDYHLPEDDNHHSHRRENLKSYNTVNVSVYVAPNGYMLMNTEPKRMLKETVVR
jgi:hypothetical protein